MGYKAASERESWDLSDWCMAAVLFLPMLLVVLFLFAFDVAARGIEAMRKKRK